MSVAALQGLLAVGSLQSLVNHATKVYVGKDVTADILPPPMYLIEMRLVASQALEGTMSPAAARTEVARLESEYAARVDYWRKNPPFGLESDLLGAQHQAASGFIDGEQSNFLHAALVEQSTAAAMGLRSQAAKLVENVALFKLPPVGALRQS